MRYSALIFLWLFSLVSLSAQEIYQTDVFHQMVRSLQVNIAGESSSDPYIILDSDQAIAIQFDVIEEGPQHYAYSIVHCDADWKASQLMSMEYMNGFQGLTIEEYAPAMGTSIAYTNYYLELPNADVQLKVSGNYAVRVYREDEPDETVLTACFYVAEEQQLPIEAQLTTQTLIDTNRAHQQLNFSINTSRFPISYPQTDLKVWVYQNRRRDNAVGGLMPSLIGANRIEYANLRELIFEAGNEYRRMEFLTPNFNGMGVENITFHNPYYHVTLYPDVSRAGHSYSYDQDQNGRYLVNCRSCTYPDTEADYFAVHFSLDIPPLLDGSIYIVGDLFHNIFDERSRIDYNPQTGGYEKSVLLKQGHYNYSYLFVPNGETRGTPALLEGNYAPTTNEYVIHVYYRPIGERYDRLISVCPIS